MQVIAHIVLQWEQTEVVLPLVGLQHANVPILPVSLAIGDSISDVTGQLAPNIIPAPNAATWLFGGDLVTLDALEAAGVPVMWSEEVPSGA